MRGTQQQQQHLIESVYENRVGTAEHGAWFTTH